MEKVNHNDIIERLCSHGFPAFLVGGAVRDMFDDCEPHDFDIVTKATPDEISTIFNDCKVNLVGKSFGVTIVDGFEVATFRVDRFPNGNGSKNCVPMFAATIHEDLARRDITINSLALCPISGELIDNHQGISDLRNKIIRFVGDANERIAEDPNRIVRACRFLAKMQGSFASDTLIALQSNAHLVRDAVDPERIAIEVKKAMELEFPSLFFSALELIGVLDFIFPGMSECVDHDHGKWHKETVWEHLMLAGDSVNKRFPLVRLAAFLHDVGKPRAFKHENDGSFINHEHISNQMVFSWLDRLRFSHLERDTVCGLVKSHMLGGSSEMKPKAIRKFRFTLSEMHVDIKDWLRLRIADRHANLAKARFPLSDIKERASLVGLGRQEVCAPVFTVHSLVLSGGDLIKIFDLKPGPLVGKLQKHLLNFVIENGFEFNTAEHLTEEGSKFITSS